MFPHKPEGLIPGPSKTELAWIDFMISWFMPVQCFSVQAQGLGGRYWDSDPVSAFLVKGNRRSHSVFNLSQRKLDSLRWLTFSCSRLSLHKEHCNPPWLCTMVKGTVRTEAEWNCSKTTLFFPNITDCLLNCVGIYSINSNLYHTLYSLLDDTKAAREENCYSSCKTS